jgi:uncharacterized protein
MDINKDSDLDTSQIDDQRGRRSVGGLPGGGLAIGGAGGTIGIIIAVVVLLLGGNPLSTSGGLGGGLNNLQDQTTQGNGDSTLSQDCQTGADTTAREDCRVVAYVNSIQKYWTSEFSNRGQQYTPVKTTFFTDQIQTACGPATSDSGPFYCPGDKRVYIDLGFFD